MQHAEYPKDTFALGSSQYAGIYRKYVWFRDSKEVKNNRFNDMVDYRQSLTKLYNSVIPEIKEFILDYAKEWKEEPQLELWNSLDLKLKLLNGGKTTTYDLQKRILRDIFYLLKNKSWDLWGALKFVFDDCPDLKDFVSNNYAGEDTESYEFFGLIIYYFGSILNLTDDDVRDIFGDFDT